MTRCVQQQNSLLKQKDAEKTMLAKVSQLPEKGRRQNDLLSNALKSLKLREEGQMVKIKEKEVAL